MPLMVRGGCKVERTLKFVDNDVDDPGPGGGVRIHVQLFRKFATSFTPLCLCLSEEITCTAVILNTVSKSKMPCFGYAMCKNCLLVFLCLVLCSYAPWCPACKAMSPAWKNVARWCRKESMLERDVRVADVDVTKNPGKLKLPILMS